MNLRFIFTEPRDEEDKKFCGNRSVNECECDDYVIDKFIELAHKYDFKDYSGDSISILCDDLPKYFDKIERLVSGIKDLMQPNYGSSVEGVRWFVDIHLFTYNPILTDELIDKLLKLEVSVIISRDDSIKQDWAKIMQKMFYSGMKVSFRDSSFSQNQIRNNLTNICDTCAMTDMERNARNEYSDAIVVCSDGSVRFGRVETFDFVSLELANIFKDAEISFDLLVEREKKLQEYLKSKKMVKASMKFMCENVCSRFHVSKDGIFKDNELVKE